MKLELSASVLVQVIQPPRLGFACGTWSASPRKVGKNIYSGHVKMNDKQMLKSIRRIVCPPPPKVFPLKEVVVDSSTLKEVVIR